MKLTQQLLLAASLIVGLASAFIPHSASRTVTLPTFGVGGKNNQYYYDNSLVILEQEQQQRQQMGSGDRNIYGNGSPGRGRGGRGGRGASFALYDVYMMCMCCKSDVMGECLTFSLFPFFIQPHKTLLPSNLYIYIFQDVEEVPVDADEEAVAAEEVMEADMAHLVNTTDQSLNYKIQ